MRTGLFNWDCGAKGALCQDLWEQRGALRQPVRERQKEKLFLFSAWGAASHSLTAKWQSWLQKHAFLLCCKCKQCNAAKSNVSAEQRWLSVLHEWLDVLCTWVWDSFCLHVQWFQWTAQRRKDSLVLAMSHWLLGWVKRLNVAQLLQTAEEYKKRKGGHFFIYKLQMTSSLGYILLFT